MKKFLRRLLFSLVVFSVAGAAAQFREHHRGQDPQEVKRQQELAKAQNKQRAKEIQDDTNKLLDLATELKKSVDAAGENTLSLEVIRKTDEIEKLAKRVRGKMKETYEVPDTTHLPDATSR